MGGIHSATVTWWKRSSPGRPRSCANATTDSSSDAAIVPQATQAAVRLSKYRTPSNPLRAAPMPGSTGMSQIKSIASAVRRHHRIKLISSMFTVSLLR